MQRTYIAIDLKSFYASVECAERHLDPLTTNLVVADESRTEKTICLAVTPSLKSCGIPGRARLFEVVQKVEALNRSRLGEAIRAKKAVRNESGAYAFAGYSHDEKQLREDLSLGIGYITALPRMSLYMEYSTRIFSIYLKYVAPEDIHVYSVDECFIDVTPYLDMYHMTARGLAMTMIRDVLAATGITATCGIGPNLYLCKVAMDIMAKHVQADENGVRIAELDEIGYRRQLWAHRPLTDFWRVGRGIAAKLEQHQLYTMGDVARCSLDRSSDGWGEGMLYRLFGVNAELLIDHAWGREPCTIADIKGYKPENNSLSSGQVLKCPYPHDKGSLIIREMADALGMELLEKHLVTDQISLYINYDTENISKGYKGPVADDYYGRRAPKPVHGSIRLDAWVSSSRLIAQKAAELYEQITDPALTIRRVTVCAVRVIPEGTQVQQPEQLDLFTDQAALERQRLEEEQRLGKDRALQLAALNIKKKFGKNAILMGTSLQEGGTAMERNEQVGGHKA